MAVVIKSYKNVLIRVFLHAEFSSALKRSQNLWFLRNMQKMEKKKNLLSLFSIFLDFCIKVSIKNSKYQQNNVS